jgi:hypothetical protein
MNGRSQATCVPLEGWLVECESTADAMAVERADAILGDRHYRNYSPTELDELAVVLRHYDRQSAAEALARRASRLRAALFLKYSVGYDASSSVGRASG